MALKLNRASSAPKTLTIAVGATDSDVLVLDGFAMGMVFLPSTFDGTTVTFKCCDTYGGTYVVLEDSSGNVVTVTTAASQCFALPEAVFGAPFGKLVAGSAQTDTDTLIKVTMRG